MKHICILIILLLTGCATVVDTSNPLNSRKLSSSTPQTATIHYDEILEKVRVTLKQNSPREQERVSKKVSETLLVDILQKNPDALKADADALIKQVMAEQRAQKDQTKHLRLVPPPGKPGYSNLKFYVTHPYFEGPNQFIPAGDLVQVWVDFIKQAKRKIILNVYEFNLEAVAQALAEKAKSGVAVQVGIDSDTIEKGEENKKAYEILKSGGVTVVSVDSVKLNHQKMAAIDWDNIDEAKVLFSSGNLTQSCLGPEGDLVNIEKHKRPRESIPNANHMITMDSWLLANLVYHELMKTMNPEYKYRGAQYPILGSYQITGPGVNPETLEAYPENSVIISFSPGGGFRNINKNLIAHFIRKSEGPIRMVQFAYSSPEVMAALLEKAQAQGDKFDFKSVGETAFAMQKWSKFLAMSGLDRIKIKKGKYRYDELTPQPFADVLGEENYEKLRDNIRIAPLVYSTREFEIDGKKYRVNAKIHHKILAAGDFAVVGTSFNFSKAAQTNNEQILIFKSHEMAQKVAQITDWLSAKSPRSVYEEAYRRNAYSDKDDDDDDVDDDASGD